MEAFATEVFTLRCLGNVVHINNLFFTIWARPLDHFIPTLYWIINILSRSCPCWQGRLFSGLLVVSWRIIII